MDNILVTGSQGFIGSYLCAEFLENGYVVTGIDNYSKYGKVKRPHDNHKNFKFIEGDVLELESYLGDNKIDYIVNLAAMIGGISYFHKYAYDLLVTNERINAAVFDFAIKRHKNKSLKRIIQFSSSMVFENTSLYPTPETEVSTCPPPSSTYGFQKLASEYFCKGAYEQYGLQYTIVRPFNCVGIGEEEALGEKETLIGNNKMMMSHVLPDIIHRALELGVDNPMPILGSGNQIRCYTNGKDIARGVRIALESDKAVCEDFNISTPVATSVTELVSMVYRVLYKCENPTLSHEKPFEYDVQKRVPDISKAKEILNFNSEISLEYSVREVCEWMKCKLIGDKK